MTSMVNNSKGLGRRQKFILKNLGSVPFNTPSGLSQAFYGKTDPNHRKMIWRSLQNLRGRGFVYVIEGRYSLTVEGSNLVSSLQQ